jgi:hypothetical protein
MYYLAMRLDWKLKDYLDAHQVTVYALAQQLGGHTKLPGLYAITSGDPAKRPRRVAFDTVEGIITALRALTGKPVAVSDLLEYQEPVTGALEEPAATHARDQSDRQGTAGTASENGAPAASQAPTGQPLASSSGIDPESRAWLDADLSRLAELGPYPWAEGEAEEGLPVRYIEGQGFVIGDKQ